MKGHKTFSQGDGLMTGDGKTLAFNNSFEVFCTMFMMEGNLTGTR